MKKTLILIRHASAEENNFTIKDFDRQLIDKGLSEAAKMGRWMADKKINPDHIITSSAPRAYKTAEIIASQLQFDISSIESIRNLYDGGPNAYLDQVVSTPETSQLLILFGHNPDISYFGEYLSDAHIGSMKKCSIVIIEFADQKWEEISAGTGKFISYITPKEVKEAS